MKNTFKSIAAKLFITVALFCNHQNASAANPIFLDQYNGVTASRLTYIPGQFAIISFYNPGAYPVIVVYREKFSDGYGPEEWIQVAGRSYARVKSRSTMVEIFSTEAMADEPASGGSRHDMIYGHGPAYFSE